MERVYSKNEHVLYANIPPEFTVGVVNIFAEMSLQ